jgi:hypothetical protein
MYKKRIMLVLMAVVLNSVYSQEGFTFRDIRWGTSFSEVSQSIKKYGAHVLTPYLDINSAEKNIENVQFIGDPFAKVAGYDAVATYVFFDEQPGVGGSFHKGYYTIRKFRNARENVTAYQDLLNKLSTIYGTPYSLLPITDRDYEEDMRNKVAKKYISIWKKNNSTIELELTYTYYSASSEETYWSLYIIYKSPAYNEIINKAINEKKASIEGL